VATPSTFQVYVAGVPTLPSKSMARTENVCEPASVSVKPHSKAPRCMFWTISKPHGSYGNASTLHSKVTSGSFEWKVKIASSIHVGSFGLTSMKASGASFAGSGA
jgi:hypothetical protein